jgi:hypothetical protein
LTVESSASSSAASASAATVPAVVVQMGVAVSFGVLLG